MGWNLLTWHLTWHVDRFGDMAIPMANIDWLTGFVLSDYPHATRSILVKPVLLQWPYCANRSGSASPNPMTSCGSPTMSEPSLPEFWIRRRPAHGPSPAGCREVCKSNVSFAEAQQKLHALTKKD